MNLQAKLVQSILVHKPTPPEEVARSKHDVTLSWLQPGLHFLQGALLYQLQRKEKIPPWVMEYSGSKTTRRIDNLAPCCPYKFRLRVIVKATAVPKLAEIAIQHFGSEETARDRLREIFGDLPHLGEENYKEAGGGDVVSNMHNDEIEGCRNAHIHEKGDKCENNTKSKSTCVLTKPHHSWLESQWSDVATASTESVGASAVCFCMAVRGGYMKHVQVMLEERPELVGIINNSDGFTPLATAIKLGDMAMVRYLLSMGAEADQRCTSGQTPLHLAVLGKHTVIIDLLLEKGADFNARDKNGLRAVHYAVDSGDLFTLRHVLDRGGDVTVVDSNGWTPLFRAVVQGAPTAVVEELVRRGSDVTIVDRAGLSLAAAAQAQSLMDRHGRARESVCRLVQAQPRERALAAFSRLTKKISTVHTITRH